MCGFRLRLTALLLAIVMLASCTHGGSPSSPRSGQPAGGTLRLGMQNVPFYSMDPQREYEYNTWELFRCCLLRTLMSYNGLGGPSSTEPQPDLATGLTSSKLFAALATASSAECRERPAG